MSYFVRINDERGVRRRLLESSKEMLYALKGYYAFLEFRDQKREAATELQTILKELSDLMMQLQQLLPEESLKDLEQYLPKPATRTKKGGKTGKRKGGKQKDVEDELPPPPQMSEMERLHSALANIEDRLNKL